MASALWSPIRPQCGFFDAQTLTPVTPAISVPTSFIFRVASTPDGQEAVVDNLQGWRLIDLDAQQPVGPWIPAATETIVLIGVNGTTFYARSPSGGGEAWDLSPSNLRSAACGLAGRNLTEQEWAKYLSWAGPRRATCPQYPLS